MRFCKINFDDLKLIVILKFVNPQLGNGSKMTFHQSQPVLKPGPTGTVISEDPHLWGA
jgi:hypothetical protein